MPLPPPHVPHCPSSVSPPLAATVRLSYDRILTSVRILIRETRARPRYGTAMRSYALVLGDRQQIRAQLESHIVGRRHLDKDAGDLSAALAAIEAGANEAQAGNVVYRVESNAHPVPLSTTDFREGTREELVAELERLRDDVAPGRTDKAAAYQEAIDDLLGGKACAGVRRTVFLVTQTGE